MTVNRGGAGGGDRRPARRAAAPLDTRSRRLSARAAGLALAGLLALPGAAGAADPAPAPTLSAAAAAQPDGYGAAKFGMSLKEVWGLYPKAQLMPEKKMLGNAAVLDGPYIERLELHDQKVDGLEKPTDVELRFWKGKLWAVVVYFGDNDPQEVAKSLTRRYGPSTAKNPNLPLWVGDKVTTTATINQKWYGFSDNAMSAEAGAWVTGAMRGTWTGETPEEAAERNRRMAELTPGGSAQGAPTPAPKAHTHAH